jgi:polysaccharide pyruvyl transferase WcaK-like protein
MKLTDVLATNLERSLLIGYYGGGNYGDELLLEVLANLLAQRGVKQVSIAYQTPENYGTYHRDFGYPIVPMYNKWQLLQAIIRHKTIIVGGGGLWGLDMNANILLLSLLLFCSRWLLGKRVYLLGIGYYGSTSRSGHVAAWLAGKAAAHVVARDEETLRNFSAITKRVDLDRDIAWNMASVDMTPYQTALVDLESRLPVQGKTIIITLRRFKSSQAVSYTAVVEAFIAANPDKQIVVGIMEPRTVDPENYQCILQWHEQYPNVHTIDFSFNPIALYLLFQKHANQLFYIGPQFHMIITAYIAHVPCFPLVYDNKVVELFKQIAPTVQPFAVATVQAADMQPFVDAWYGGTQP